MMAELEKGIAILDDSSTEIGAQDRLDLLSLKHLIFDSLKMQSSNPRVIWHKQFITPLTSVSPDTMENDVEQSDFIWKKNLHPASYIPRPCHDMTTASVTFIINEATCIIRSKSLDDIPEKLSLGLPDCASWWTWSEGQHDQDQEEWSLSVKDGGWSTCS